MINKKTDIIYLSGPMTGIPEYNHPVFNNKAKQLRDTGYSVFNPAENDGGSTHKSRSFYLREDIKELLKCTCVMVLPNCRKSKGALLEVAIANELEMPVFDEQFKLISEETICQEADRIVSHDRGSDYGSPFEDFSRTGRLWGAILEKWAKETKGDIPIHPRLVGLCMVALKVSREVHKPKRDTRVDMAGYAKTIDMVIEEETNTISV